MYEKSSQGRAALARRPHGGECNGPDGQIEIGRRGDDRGVVTAEFKDRAGKTGGEARADVAAHGG